MAVLIDTNLLVYRFDSRDLRKQRTADSVLRQCIAEKSARIPHQAIVEFFSVVTRPIKGGPPLMPAEEASRETEALLNQFPVLYPNDRVLRTALQGAAAYQLSWLMPISGPMQKFMASRSFSAKTSSMIGSMER